MAGVRSRVKTFELDAFKNNKLLLLMFGNAIKVVLSNRL